MPAVKEEGRVKWFRNDKGYGFITPDSGGDDVFVHYTGILGEGYRTLEGVDRVEFERTHSDRGDQATNVVVLTQRPTEDGGGGS